MKYFREHDVTTNLWTISISIILAIAVMLGGNSCGSEIWNDGICPDCKVRYELKEASEGIKYYACPECRREVERPAALVVK